MNNLPVVASSRALTVRRDCKCDAQLTHTTRCDWSAVNVCYVIGCCVDDDVMSLSSAVTESTQLPFTVRCVAPVPDQSRDQYSALLDQQLTISKIYDSTFLLANPIHGGMLSPSIQHRPTSRRSDPGDELASALLLLSLSVSCPVRLWQTASDLKFSTADC